MNNISEIEQKRTGGQLSLMGYSYQLLYSIYLTLKYVKVNSYAKFEEIEDIDTYKVEQNENNNTIYHTQLKYSTIQQDASFLKSVLKNFLEVYLLDKSNENRYFKLVYNFKISQGNLHKLINNKLDKKSTKYWRKVKVCNICHDVF